MALSRLIPVFTLVIVQALAFSRPPSKLDFPILHVEPHQIAEVAGCLAVGAFSFSWFRDFEHKKKWAAFEQAQQARMEERRQKAFIAPKDSWNLQEISQYDGGESSTGPLLIAVDGYVYNCWKGSHFYGRGCEYSIFAGRDATRLLAKRLLEEEPIAERTKPLTLGERAVLAAWVQTFKKYDMVGRFETIDM